MTRYKYIESDEIFDSYDDAVAVAFEDEVPEDYFESALNKYSIEDILYAISEGNPSMWEDIITAADDDYLSDVIVELEDDDNEDEI